MRDQEDTEDAGQPQPLPDQGEDQGAGVPLTRTEIRDIERAVKRGWKIPERAYASIPEKLVALVESSEKPRVIIAGARALNAMLSLNNAAAGTGETGPPINLNIHTGEPPAPIEGQGNITIPDNGRSIHADHS